jgi:hypothetical protein
MIPTCQKFIAFWDGRSKGTADAIRIAREHHIPRTVHLWRPTLPDMQGFLEWLRKLYTMSTAAGVVPPASFVEVARWLGSDHVAAVLSDDTVWIAHPGD